MKFNTPGCPRLFRGFPLLEKGGISLGRGAYPEGWLPYAPLGTGLTDRDGLVFLVVIDHATLQGKPTAAAKTLGDILGHEHLVTQPYGNIVAEYDKLLWHLVPCRLAVIHVVIL